MICASDCVKFSGFFTYFVLDELRQYSPIVCSKRGNKRRDIGSRRNVVVRASSSSLSSSSDSNGSIAPLRFESPVGQFLSQMLISHPHLVPVAVEQQLEQLKTDREAEKEKEEPSASGTDLVLYRRNAEVILAVIVLSIGEYDLLGQTKDQRRTTD